MSARPAGVLVDRVDREADDLDVTAVEVRLDLRHVAQLRRADRREVLRMREEHRPRVADPVVKVDAPLRRLRLEVGCRVADMQCHSRPPLRSKRVRADRRAVRLPRRSAYDSEPARTSITSRSKAGTRVWADGCARCSRPTRSATASPLRRTPTRRGSRSSRGRRGGSAAPARPSPRGARRSRPR